MATAAHLLRQMGSGNVVAPKELAHSPNNTCINKGRQPLEATTQNDLITVSWNSFWQATEVGRIAQYQDTAQRLHLT